jgi:hypothetical protein
MKFLKCLIIFCMSRFALSAQPNISPGYIIGLNHDTLRGYVEIHLESEFTTLVKFKNDQRSPTKAYTPKDLLEFGLENDIYKSLRFVNAAEDSIVETAFVKQLVKGEYNLFAYLKPDRNFYLLQKDTIIYFLYDRISRNSGEIIQEWNYFNYLNLIAVPCEKLSNLVSRVGFNDKDMAAFILKVDNCDSPQNAKNFYQKPKTLVQPTIFAGGLPAPSAGQFSASFILHITLPRIDKKNSINIGINYSYLTTQSSERSDYYYPYTLYTHSQIFSIPVTFQYNFTNSLIQPYFYAGMSGACTRQTNNSLNFNIPTTKTGFGLSLVAGIGIQARVSPHLFIRADWRYEVMFQHPAIGVAYQL